MVVRGQDIAQPVGGPRPACQFSISSDGDFLLVPVIIDGVTYQMVLDTGSTRTTYDASLRKHLGRPKRSGTAVVSSGIKKVEIFDAPVARLGSISLKTSAEVVCTDFGDLQQMTGYKIDGILGMDNLESLVVDIDFDREKIFFYKGTGPSHGEPIKIRYRSGLPCVSVDVGRDESREFVIDTGSSNFCAGSIPAKEFDVLAARGVMRESIGVLAVDLGGSQHVRRGVMDNLTIGPFTHKNLEFNVSRGSMDGFLGIAFWKRYNMILDFTKNTMYLMRSKQFNNDNEYNITGIVLRKRDGLYVIDSVAAGSVAERVGVKRGDVLLRVDGKDATPIRAHALKLLICASGQRRRLALQRGAHQFEVSLELRRSKPEKATSEHGREKTDSK